MIRVSKKYYRKYHVTRIEPFSAFLTQTTFIRKKTFFDNYTHPMGLEPTNLTLYHLALTRGGKSIEVRA